jgi:hypothetical protein
MADATGTVQTIISRDMRAMVGTALYCWLPSGGGRWGNLTFEIIERTYLKSRFLRDCNVESV